MIKSLEFSEIRSTKRSHSMKDSEGIRILDTPGILDPTTGNVLTVAEAIKLHLLDVRTGEMILISGEKMSLEKAAEHKLIDADLAVKLSDHLDAVRRELSEAENGHDTSEKRIKVTTSTATISPSNIKTIADAIKDGTVDPIQGLYKLPDGSAITITDAYQRGLLIKNDSVKIKSTPLCLADAISHGLIDQSGWVIDRNAGDKFRLDLAIENDLILSNCQEIVDTRNDVKVTVADAIASGLLNAKTGRYINPITKEKLTFTEAKNRQLIVRPMTLKDVCDLNLIDRDGMIFSPTRKRQLNILDAIKIGILDGDKINSISLGNENSELVTLNEAIGSGVVGLNNNFKNTTTSELMTIQEAVDEGLISSVSQKSIFDIDAFKESYSNEFVSLNESLSKGVLVRSHDCFKIDIGKNQLTSLSDGIGMGVVRPEVNEMLNRRVGVFMNGRELSVLDLVLYDLIDPKSGYLIDNSQFVPLNQAIERKIITPEGALLLSSLLNITLTTETVTKMEKRYITIANTQIADYPDETSLPESDGSLKLADAIEQKIFDPSSGVFTIPNTDRLVSFEECIQLGLINPESLRIVDPKYKEEINVHRALERNLLDSTGHYRSPDGWIPMNQSIEKGIIKLQEETRPTSISHITTTTYEVPPLPLSKIPSMDDMTSPEPLEISPGIYYDPSTALVIDMKTGKSENIIQAVKDNLIDPKSVKIIDHSTGDAISFDDAIKKDIISPHSGEITDSTGKKTSLIDAVKTGLLIVAGAPVVAAAGAINSLKLIFDPSTNQHIPVELAYERGLVGRDEISDYTHSETRSALVSQRSSFDIPTPKDMAQTPSKSRKHSASDDSMDMPIERPVPIPRKSLTSDVNIQLSDNKTKDEKSPISSEKIPHSTEQAPKVPVKVSISSEAASISSEKSPTQVSVNEALQRGLLDLKNDSYIDPNTNDIIPIKDAINKGLLVSSTAENVEDEILNISPVHVQHKKDEMSSDTLNESIKPIPAKRKSIESASQDEKNAVVENLPSDENSTVDKVAAGFEKMDDELLESSTKEKKNKSNQQILDSFGGDENLKSEVGILDDGSETRVPDVVDSSVLRDIKAAQHLHIEKDLIGDEVESEIIGSKKDDGEQVMRDIEDISKKFIESEKLTEEENDIAMSDTSKIMKDLGVKSSDLDSMKDTQNKLDDADPKNRQPTTTDLETQNDNSNSKIHSSIAENISNIQQPAEKMDSNLMTSQHAEKDVTDKKSQQDHDTLSSKGTSEDSMSQQVKDADGKLSEVIARNDDDDAMKIDNDKVPQRDVEKVSDFKGEEGGNNEDKFNEKLKVSEAQQSQDDKISSSDTHKENDLSQKEHDATKEQRKLVSFEEQEKMEFEHLLPEAEKSVEKETMKQIPSKTQISTVEGAKELKEQSKVKDSEVRELADEVIDQHEVIDDSNASLDSAQLTSSAIKSEPTNDGLKTKESTAKESKPSQIHPETSDNSSEMPTTDKSPKDPQTSDGNAKATQKSQQEASADNQNIPEMTSADENLESSKLSSDPQDSDSKNEKDPNISSISQIPHTEDFSEQSEDPLKSSISSSLDTKPPQIPSKSQPSTFQDPTTTTIIPSIQSEKPQDSQKSDSQLGKDIANAAKMGLMAIVGAPILAGMAVADSVKNIARKSSSEKDPMVLSRIQELSESMISEKGNDGKKPKELEIDENLSQDELENAGAFDKRTSSFVDPSTGDKVPFDDFIFNCGVFDPELIYVKDLNTDKYVPLAVALEKLLIDRNTGIMVEPKTGKRIPFFECLKRKWVIQKEPEKLLSMSMQDARNAGLLDDESGKVAFDGILLPVSEALHSGVLEVDNVSIRNSDGEIVPLVKAIEDGSVDLKRGIFIDHKSGESKPLDLLFKEGDLLEGIKSPISLEAAITSGLYDKQSKKFKSTDDNLLNIQNSIDSGLIDPNISEIKDTQKDQIIPLQKALDDKLIEDDLLKDTQSGQLLSLDDALERNLISTKPIKMTLIDVIVKEHYKVDKQRILNPMNGRLDTIEDAIKSGYLDIDSTLIVDDKNERVVPASDAISCGLIDTINGRLTYPDLNLKNAYERGYILSSKKPISLSDAIIRNLYNPITGKLMPNENGNEISLDDCIKQHEISTNDLIIHDPKSNNIISVSDAIKSGLIDAKNGCVNEPYNGEQLTFNEAVDRGIIILSKRKCSLPEAVFKGLYDPTSGTFANTLTTEKLSTDRAIKRGFIDPQSTVVNIGGKILPFELSVETGMVDTKRGTITDEYGNKIDFREAFDRGILVEVRKPIGLYEALVKNIYDESSGLFMDPKSGQRLTLEQAISVKLIDPNSVQVKDSATNIYRDISLLDAIHKGMIDDESHVKIDSRKLTLRQAFDLGILCDTKAPISIQRAIHQGIYDSQSGKIIDPTTNKKMTLHEAMRRWVINPHLPCYFDENEETLMSLTECCRMKMIDRREGVFKEPGSNVFVPLNEALNLGLIVDIESGGFGLYEILSMKLYDVNKRKFINPANGCLITMTDAIQDDIISPILSLVKDLETNSYIKLSDAIKKSIIDPQNAVYVYPQSENSKRIDLQEARRLGLIVSHQKLISLEDAISMGLYSPESGKFIDPSSNEIFDLQSCIDNGLIDVDTTILKNISSGQEMSLKMAIEKGDVNVVKGCVIDPDSKMSRTFDVAFNKGLLVTVRKPLTGKTIERIESFESILSKHDVPSSTSAKSSNEISLDDAIKSGIIDAENVFVKDPKTGQFVSLSKAMSDEHPGVIDALNKKIAIDPSATSLSFDPTCVIYTRMPETFENAVESGHLDLSNGTYINPEYAINCNLKEAITSGLIDPDSALIKDGAKGKLIRLPEAFRKGLIDSDKFNVVDTSTSKLLPLKSAVDDAILITPKRSLGLIDALKYNLYESEPGCFKDPFISTATTSNAANHPLMTLNDAITKGLIDPSTTMVRDVDNREIAPLSAAIASGLIDPVHGRLVNDNETIDLLKAREKGLLLPAEQRVSNSVGICLLLNALCPFFVVLIFLKISLHAMPHINYTKFNLHTFTHI